MCEHVQVEMQGYYWRTEGACWRTEGACRLIGSGDKSEGRSERTDDGSNYNDSGLIPHIWCHLLGTSATNIDGESGSCPRKAPYQVDDTEYGESVIG